MMAVNVPGDYGVYTEGLTKDFGLLRAVDNVSLRVERGEFFGFLGPNGAGKTTTILMLTGLLRPTSGRIQVAGFDLARQPLEVKARVGLMQEEPTLYHYLTGEEHLLFAARMHNLPHDVARTRADELLDVLDLKGARRILVSDYSAGMRRKISLAAALIHDPAVLFLDEPFSGIDVVSSRVIKDILHILTERQVTIFFSSHVLELVEKLCHRVAIINKGAILRTGSPDDLRKDAGLPAAASLEDVFLQVVGRREVGSGLSWLR